jgi:hypothetical protein
MDIHEPQAACASSYRVQQPVLRTPSALLLSSSREDATELARWRRLLSCAIAAWWSICGDRSAISRIAVQLRGGVMSYFRLSPLATSRQ